jgi:hypothetical protein
MFENGIRRAGLIFFLICMLGGTAAAQDVTVGEMSIDHLQWGERFLKVPIENHRNDSARISIYIQTVYPQHYLSGLDRLDVDTLLVIPPKTALELFPSFEIPGSFGRVGVRAQIYWRFDSGPTVGPDSTFQVFTNVFQPTGQAGEYAGKRHSAGPAYSIMEHFQLNFEYPTLMLYLLARGQTLKEISTLFKAEMEYTQLTVNRFRKEGFFPRADDSLSPGLLAVSEKEGYPLKEKAKAAITAFTKWYEDGGGKKLNDILSDIDLDSDTRKLPSVQMPILLALLEQPWDNPQIGFEPFNFENQDHDIAMQNQPHWIMEGGDFFLPKLCLAVFEDNGVLHLSTFSPNPELPFEKATIYDMRKAAQDAGDEAITKIEATRMLQAVKEARKQGLTKELAAKLEPIIGEAQKGLEFCEPYKKAYLADYIYRMAIGGYFVEHKPEQGLDCVRIIY